MRIPLAWHNLVHKKVRSAVAVAGVTFAIVLMFLQLGFLEAVKASATVMYDALDFDILLRSRDYLHLADARAFPRERLVRAAGAAGVVSAAGVDVTSNSWRSPQDGQRRAILCLGVPLDKPVMRDRQLQSLIEQQLKRPDALLIDTLTRSEYGPRNKRRFGPADHGAAIELNAHIVYIAGHYTCGTGLSSSASAIMSDRGLQNVTPWLSPNECTLGLVHVADNTDSNEVARRLQVLLSDDVDVLTRERVISEELHHWVFETNYGLIFQTGVLVAVIVGTAIVYQVLASDVANMMPEYATLKAIGYGNRYLAWVIVQQSLVLALVGYVVGVGISLVLYYITSVGAQIPVRMTWQNLLLVLVLCHAMCVMSGLAAARKAFRADPADLF